MKEKPMRTTSTQKDKAGRRLLATLAVSAPIIFWMVALFS